MDDKLTDKVSTAPEVVDVMANNIYPFRPGDWVTYHPEEIAATLRALSAEVERLKGALEAVNSEILLDGHLQELVSAALGE